jgi:hypothetical protein
MGAMIVLTGHAENIEEKDELVSFHVLTGPATRKPPRGLKLFDPVQYYVECTVLQWRHARRSADDESDLIVEGYIEPRQDPDTDQLYIAVVALSVQSVLAQQCQKLEQLTQALHEARDAYRQARESGASVEELEEKAAAFVAANEKARKFLQKHPELGRGETA